MDEARERKCGKVPGFEKRDQKIVEIEKFKNCPCSDRGPWNVSAEFDRCMGKLGNNVQCWSNGEVCLVGNCKILRKVLEM